MLEMRCGRGEKGHPFLTPLLVVLEGNLEYDFRGLDQIESCIHFYS
jgi:hypothetical protein